MQASDPQLQPGIERRRGAPRTTGRFARAHWVVYAFLATCLVGYVVSEITRRSGQSAPLLDGWGVATFEAVASLMCIGRAFVGRRGRAIPLVLGTGLLLWSTGDFVLTTETAGGANPPSPSLADVFYLAFYPFMYVGVMLLIR